MLLSDMWEIKLKPRRNIIVGIVICVYLCLSKPNKNKSQGGV